MYAPEVGRLHDVTLLRHNGISDDLEKCLLIDGQQFYIYGDAAYILRAWIQIAFDQISVNANQGPCNTAMSAVRVFVEWNYKDLKQMWARNDFSRLLTVRRFPFGLLYTASAVLLNFKTCIEKGGQTSTYFNFIAPIFDEYSNI